jgi:DNA-binding response OmpR family regulator
MGKGGSWSEGNGESGVDRRKSNDTNPRRLRVLVVDDEDLIGRALSRYLLKRGYDIIATNSPETAMLLIQKEKFDVIISDIMMGAVSGIDLVRKLRNSNLDSKVMLMSGTFTWDDVSRQLEGLKLDAFLEKPFELKFFHEKLMEITSENTPA